MNERRFHELAREVDRWCDEEYAGNEFYDLFWKEKFAELIIKECAIVASLCSHKDCSSGYEFYHASSMIKEYFGVK